MFCEIQTIQDQIDLNIWSLLKTAIFKIFWKFRLFLAQCKISEIFWIKIKTIILSFIQILHNKLLN